MNLVCFPNYCAGGLLCDLLNNKTTSLVDSTLPSVEHNTFKQNNFGFRVQRVFDIKLWNKKVNMYREQPIYNDTYFGTHIHPNYIPDLKVFNKVMVITDLTNLSKWYRFLRIFHLHLKNTDEHAVKDLLIQLKDTFVDHNDCKNIEYCDIVNGEFVIENKLNVEHFNNWSKANSWLYDNSYDFLKPLFNDIIGEI